MADTNRRRRRGQADVGETAEEVPRRRRRGGVLPEPPRRRRRGGGGEAAGAGAADPPGDEVPVSQEPAEDSPETFEREGAPVATEVTLPQLGESVTEGTITAWLANVGDRVEADQPLFELSSDKIDTEVPSPASGTLTEIKVQLDETVDVGTVEAVIGGEEAPGGDTGAGDASGEQAQAPQEAPAQEAPAQAGAEPEDTGTAPDVSDPTQADAEGDGGDAQAAGSMEEREAVAQVGAADDGAGGDGGNGGGEATGDGGGETAGTKTEPTGQPAVAGTYERSEAEVAETAAPAPSGDEAGNGRGEGVLASPIVRRMVAENGLDLSTITPSGEGGRVTREDVEAAIAGKAEPQAQPQPAAAEAEAEGKAEPAARPKAPDTPQGQQARPRVAPQPERQVSLEAGDRERVENLSRIRQRIAAKMMESQQSSAQLTTVQEADMTRIMRLRDRRKDEFKAREGVSLSPFAFLCRAAVLVLRRPEFQNVNAQADWEAGKVKYHDYVNLGIAVDTERGLLVPNIKSADDLTLPALARAIAQAAAKARGKGQLEISDIEGGTFTVTNTGSRGVLIDTPILNYPEVGILGTGAIKKRPVVVSDEQGDSISVREMIYLCLTYDHRLLDGADAARFVTEVAHVVETHNWEQEIGY